MQFLLHYNKQSHRRESHSRIEDWLDNVEREGIREMCSWERFCTFAREPEQRKVGIDARVTVDGVAYEVEPDLAGELHIRIASLLFSIEKKEMTQINTKLIAANEKTNGKLKSDLRKQVGDRMRSRR